jgi:CDGSH-type Zn-finger protein
MSQESDHLSRRKIVATTDGPYLVFGNVALVAKTQIVSEQGEPLTWKKDQTIDAEPQALCGIYSLCRCGQSGVKPFCDGTHQKIAFDGTETADTRATAERQEAYSRDTPLLVRHDDALCAGSGFCGNRQGHIRQLALVTAEAAQQIQIIGIIGHCPSGSLTCSLAGEAGPLEPDLPQQVAVTTEITSAGPIAGPLWVTGNIPIERSDGQLFETRNRVTLCCCGRSHNKPLCDCTHREP